MNDIKTKESVMGNTIKILDKSANLSEKLKDSFIRMKKNLEHGCYAKGDSSEEYVSDKVTETSEIVSLEAVYQLMSTEEKSQKR